MESSKNPTRFSRGSVNGGKYVNSSDIQNNVYLWAKSKFNEEEVMLNYPFEFNGKYAFGDIVFLRRKLVVEYDEIFWHSTNKQLFFQNQHDSVIKGNGFEIVHFNYVCFEEIEDVVRKFPVGGG